jgi:hypothetical protein|tara:strand:+ start:939 stop:1211 length:273 start_codon:yes stop_codon:yes gene_type:complete
LIGINFSKIAPTLNRLVTGRQFNASQTEKTMTIVNACEVLAAHVNNLDSECDPHLFWLKKEIVTLLKDEISQQELAEDYDISAELESLYF